MKGIYSFHWDCGRMGEVNGLFVADSADVEKAIGREVYLGEVLGKHSEIYGVLDTNAVVLKSDNPAHVEMFESLDLTTGHNPLAYLEDQDDEE